MPSIILNIGIEVEIFYEVTHGEFDAIHAVVQTPGLPLAVEHYTKVQAIDTFEKDPARCIADYEKANRR